MCDWFMQMREHVGTPVADLGLYRPASGALSSRWFISDHRTKPVLVWRMRAFLVCAALCLPRFDPNIFAHPYPHISSSY